MNSIFELSYIYCKSHLVRVKENKTILNKLFVLSSATNIHLFGILQQES